MLNFVWSSKEFAAFVSEAPGDVGMPLKNFKLSNVDPEEVAQLSACSYSTQVVPPDGEEWAIFTRKKEAV